MSVQIKKPLTVADYDAPYLEVTDDCFALAMRNLTGQIHLAQGTNVPERIMLGTSQGQRLMVALTECTHLSDRYAYRFTATHAPTRDMGKLNPDQPKILALNV